MDKPTKRRKPTVKPARLISAASRTVRERPLTPVIRVGSVDDVPPDFFRIAVTNPAIYSKIQVLSHRNLQPIFVEAPQVRPTGNRVAYWAHKSILPELRRWLRDRVFNVEELT